MGNIDKVGREIMPTANELVKNISQPSKRTNWKRKYEERKHQAHMLLREVDRLNRERDEVPRLVRTMCRIVGRLVRGRTVNEVV